MNRIIFILISIWGFGSLISKGQTINPKIRQAESIQNMHYVSIDGLWRVTPETALKFPNGTLYPVIQLSGNLQGKLTARGCFIWDNRFYDYWDLKSVHFNDSTNQLVLVANNGSIYKGFVDKKKELIRGFASGSDGDTLKTNKLNFIRDKDLDVNKLFVPYPPGKDGSISYTYQCPEDCRDQLQTSSIFKFVTDSSAFYNLMGRIIRQKFGRLESLLIIKNQKLIIEEYFYGYSRTQLHHIHSCTKSITSLLLGIALKLHNKLNVNQSIFDFFPQFDSLKTPEKAKITLKHVLTMTPGFTDDRDLEFHNPDEQAKQILSLPIVSVPGEKFKYNNNCTDLLGDIIYSLENKQADEFAKEVLFNKLGISTFNWERENGVLHCFSDLHLYPRDMAKIGLLVLNKGSWNGEQIIPKEWIDESTKPYVAESKFFDYGYQWWYRSKRNKSWWDHPVQGSKNEHDMFLALGYGGQYIMVIRDLNMVIVTTSSDYNEENDMAHQKVPMVIEDLLPLFN